MCRFVVVYWKREIPKESGYKKIVDLLKRGGPDSQNIVKISNVHLFHSRLSIIDLELSANQPFIKDEFAVVFNGEIYNYRELREQLINEGYKFVTNSDTEVILEGFRAWGSSLFEKLEGMYAVVIYNKVSKELLAVRDYYGVKPLYYSDTEDFVAFSSDIRIFRELGFSAKINDDAIKEFLEFGFISGDNSKTIMDGIRKVQPGNGIRYSSGEIKTLPGLVKLRCHATTLDLRQSVISGVSSRLVADVPVGLFLSSGVDSTLIAHILCNELGKRPDVYHIAFDDPLYDESDAVLQIAQRYDLNCEIIPFNKDDFIKYFDLSIEAMSEPLADDSFGPMLKLSEFASKKLKVALSGDGADELFLGYKRMILWYYLNKFPRWVLNLIKVVLKLSLVKTHFLSKHLSPEQLDKLYEVYLSNDRITYQDLIKKCHIPNSLFLNEVKYCPSFQDDITSFMTYSVLDKSDRSSMFNGLELREPFLSSYTTQYSQSLKITKSISAFKGKIALRRLLANYDKMTSKRKKMGFSSPLNSWIQAYIELHSHDVDSFDWKIIGLNGVTVKEIFRDEGKMRLKFHLMILMRWYESNIASFRFD